MTGLPNGPLVARVCSPARLEQIDNARRLIDRGEARQ